MLCTGQAVLQQQQAPQMGLQVRPGFAPRTLGTVNQVGQVTSVGGTVNAVLPGGQVGSVGPIVQQGGQPQQQWASPGRAPMATPPMASVVSQLRAPAPATGTSAEPQPCK